jgi:hypothetical protein
MVCRLKKKRKHKKLTINKGLPICHLQSQSGAMVSSTPAAKCEFRITSWFNLRTLPTFFIVLYSLFIFTCSVVHGPKDVWPCKADSNKESHFGEVNDIMPHVQYLFYRVIQYQSLTIK